MNRMFLPSRTAGRNIYLNFGYAHCKQLLGYKKTTTGEEDQKLFSHVTLTLNYDRFGSLFSICLR